MAHNARVAFTKAWSSHDLTSAAAYLADDVAFDGPGGHSEGTNAYLEVLTPFAQRVTGMRIIAALGDNDQALIMYEVTIGPSVTVTCAEHLTIRDGKIQADRLTFDTAAARAAQAPPAAAE